MGQLYNVNFKSAQEIVGASDNNTVTISFQAETHLPIKQGIINIETPILYTLKESDGSLTDTFPIDENTVCSSENF